MNRRNRMFCIENGFISELFTGSLVIGDGDKRKDPRRGGKKIDPWDGKWKKRENFYFSTIGEESLDFLVWLLNGESP